MFPESSLPMKSWRLEVALSVGGVTALEAADMKRLEGSKRWLDGSVVDVCRVDFWFPVQILVDFICYCMGLVLG